VSVIVIKAKFNSVKARASVEGFIDNQRFLETPASPRSKNPTWQFTAKM